ncbi:hypothetical protein AUK40_04130 [Candidatus Wirthbacteria bacterium CG2_30_54_11]|uniref:Lipoprotein n=1 Tax=Candidatus Wirthbacteria bacterium CG2_30_54_11 TaxID=1817892 RepID=A0A1J5IXP4_9BACT|nr:MAG: hypothetical protein AUK40_04130 [Candidatus Wirthbacteria bacterium CG2_30_54_11]
MFKKLTALFSVVALVVVATGCTFSKQSDSGAAVSKSEAQNNPQAVLDDSFGKTADVKSAKGSLAITFDVESSSDSGSGNIDMSFAVDSTDETEPVADISLTAALDMGASGSVELQNTQFRVTGNKLYFNIAGLDITGEELGGDSITAMLAAFFDQWFVIDPESPMVQEIMASATESVDVSVSTEDQLTPEQMDSFLSILSSARFVTGVTYSTEEKVGGVNCVEVSFTGLDADGIIKLVKALNTEFGGEDAEELTAADEKEIADALKDIEASGSFWVGKDDGLLRKADLTIAMDQDGDTVTFGIVATMTDYNQPVPVQTPAGAQDFIEAITPFLESFGGSGLDTTDYSDYTDYTDYTDMYTDEELNDLLNSL